MPADAAQRKQEGLSGGDFGQSALIVKAEGNYPPASWFLKSYAGNEFNQAFH